MTDKWIEITIRESSGDQTTRRCVISSNQEDTKFSDILREVVLSHGFTRPSVLFAEAILGMDEIGGDVPDYLYGVRDSTRAFHRAAARVCESFNVLDGIGER